jgi:hypothetical protein
MTVTNLRIPREQMSRPAAKISGTQKTSLHCACSQINFLPGCVYFDGAVLVTVYLMIEKLEIFLVFLVNAFGSWRLLNILHYVQKLEMVLMIFVGKLSPTPK